MSGKLVIGLPSKGRLQENANAFFASAGLKVRQEGGRGYTGRLDGIANVEIAFLSASCARARSRTWRKMPPTGERKQCTMLSGGIGVIRDQKNRSRT